MCNKRKVPPYFTFCLLCRNTNITYNIIFLVYHTYLHGIRLHRVNGSPVYEVLQEHNGLWLITLQLVLIPQGLGQGLTHLLFIQALSCEHSELTIHSGLQFGGIPIYSTKQEHTGWLLTTWHWLFGPHGDG